MENIKDLLLATILNCDVKELSLLENLSKDDDRWDTLIVALGNEKEVDMEYIKELFEVPKTYEVMLCEKKFYRVVVEEKNEDEAMAKAHRYLRGMDDRGKCGCFVDYVLEPVAAEEVSG